MILSKTFIKIFSITGMVKYLLQGFFLCYIFSLCAWQPSDETQPDMPFYFTLMINPSGDSRTTGRAINGTFERGITMQCAEELKKRLESSLPGLHVILTRFPGERIEPLQNAVFANRLKVNLYISLHFFEQKEKVSKLFSYYVLYNPITDFWEQKNTELALLPYDQAYKSSLKKTKLFANSLYEACKKQEKQYKVVCYPPRGIPLKPLAGITSPALALEIGIRKSNEWKPLVPLLVEALEPIISGQRPCELS